MSQELQVDNHSCEQEQQDNTTTSALVSKLETILCDVELYQRLLACQQADAQKLLDSFQALLDMPQLDPSFRRSLVVATQRISKKSGLYPACHALKGISLEGEHPVFCGGFTDVYKGDSDGQAVCLKAVRVYRRAEQESFLKRFSREATLWGQLSHPNILPNYGLFSFQNRICLVTPWMKAGNVTAYLKQHPEASRVQLAVDVAEGLSYLHKNGIIHGDLKGSNVLINDAGRACLTDFGISSIADSEILAWISHPSAAASNSSARWQAPELLDIEAGDIVKNTEASDIYACACVFYEIFTGMVPFANVAREATVIVKVQSGVRSSRPPESSPAWSEYGLTQDIWSLVESCWNAAPTERPSINEILADLRKGLPHDSRKSASGSVWSPAHFRNRMHEPVDVLSASDLDSLLNLNLDVEDVIDIDVRAGLNPTISFAMDKSIALSSLDLDFKNTPTKRDATLDRMAYEKSQRGLRSAPRASGLPIRCNRDAVTVR